MEGNKQRYNGKNNLGIIKQYRNGKIVELNTRKNKGPTKKKIRYEERTHKEIKADQKQMKESEMCKEKKLACEAKISDLKQKYKDANERVKKLEAEV